MEKENKGKDYKESGSEAVVDLDFEFAIKVLVKAKGNGYKSGRGQGDDYCRVVAGRAHGGSGRGRSRRQWQLLRLLQQLLLFVLFGALYKPALDTDAALAGLGAQRVAHLAKP